MKSKRFRIPAAVIELVIVAVLALLIWIFVDVSIESILQNRAGSCISVIFDKPLVKGANRVVVYERSRVITITQEETVRQIADLFTVANCTCLCSPGQDRRIELYNGDLLVRELRQTQCGSDLYDCYEPDLLHWVLSMDSGNGEVQLRPQEQQWLDGIIEQYG